MLHFLIGIPIFLFCLLLIYIQKKVSSLKQNCSSMLQGQFFYFIFFKDALLPFYSPSLYFPSGSSSGEEGNLFIYWFTRLYVSPLWGRVISRWDFFSVGCSEPGSGQLSQMEKTSKSPLCKTSRHVRWGHKWWIWVCNCEIRRRRNIYALLTYFCSTCSRRRVSSWVFFLQLESWPSPPSPPTEHDLHYLRLKVKIQSA